VVGVLITRVVLEYVHLEVLEGARQCELHLVSADYFLVEVAQGKERELVLLGEREAVIGGLGTDGHERGAEFVEAGQGRL